MASPSTSSGAQNSSEHTGPEQSAPTPRMRSRTEIETLLSAHRAQLNDLAQLIDEQEQGKAIHFSSSQWEEAWINRDTLWATVATLEWVLGERAISAYPSERSEGKQKA